MSGRNGRGRREGGTVENPSIPHERLEAEVGRAAGSGA